MPNPIAGCRPGRSKPPRSIRSNGGETRSASCSARRGRLGVPMFDLAGLDICFIAGTLGQGGAERQLFYMLKALKENHSRVRLLCLTQREFWESRVEKLGIEIIWVGEHESRARRL